MHACGGNGVVLSWVSRCSPYLQRADWGGYTGYFADPDGFLWEVAWNPQFPHT